MQLTYKLTQADLFESLVATRNRKKWVKWAFRIIIVALLILVGLSASAFTASQLALNLLPLLGFSLLWVFMIWGSPWLLARTQYRKNPSMQAERTASFEQSGVKWRWDGGSAEYGWKTYIRWMETKNEVLLYSSPVQCNIVPKRALSAHQLSELRSLLTENVGAGTWAKGQW